IFHLGYLIVGLTICLPFFIIIGILKGNAFLDRIVFTTIALCKGKIGKKQGKQEEEVFLHFSWIIGYTIWFVIRFNNRIVLFPRFLGTLPVCSGTCHPLWYCPLRVRIPPCRRSVTYPVQHYRRRSGRSLPLRPVFCKVPDWSGRSHRHPYGTPFLVSDLFPVVRPEKSVE